MRERLIELLEEARIEALNTMGGLTQSWGERSVDYLLENGVVVLPCWIDDPVFVIPTKENGRKEITPMACLGFYIGEPCNTANCFDEKNKLYQPSFDMFGKSVFLRREEAEKALKERNNATP